MRGWPTVGLIGFCLSTFSGNASPGPGQQATWLTDYAAARAVAATASKPLLVVFR